VDDPTAVANLEAGIDHNNLINGGSPIHFTEASIIHQNIVGAGTNTHAMIDSHIAAGSPSIHFTEASIDHDNILNGTGIYSHGDIDTHVGLNDIHFSVLSGLSDVDTTGVTAGQVLTYNNSPAGWVPQDASGGGGVDNPMTADLDTNGFSVKTIDNTLSAIDSETVILKGGDNEFVVGLGSPPAPIYASVVNISAGSTTQQGTVPNGYYGTPLNGNFPGQVNIIGGDFNVINYASYTSTYDVGLGNINITAGENTQTYGSDGNGGFININAGVSNNGTGGTAYVTGGVGYFGGGAHLRGAPGVSVSYNAGSPYSSYVTAGHGGGAYITGGDADSTNQCGNVMIKAGSSRNSGTGNAGNVFITSGSASAGTPGNVYISTRQSFDNPAGFIEIEPDLSWGSTISAPPVIIRGGGMAGGTIGDTSVGGKVEIRGGGGISSSNDSFGGDVEIMAGSGGNGTSGSILISTNAGQVSGNITFREQFPPYHASFRLQSGSGLGTYFTRVKMGTTLSADTLFQLPADNGSSGNVLQSDGTGITSWAPSSDLGEFTIAGLPAAASNANSYALATDASGGRTVVRSDGTNWKVVAVEGATVA